MISGGIRTKGIAKTNTVEKPLISVITVVFNGEKTLEQTILSVVNQTYDNVEYIIVDGGSKDSTLDIIKKYEDKIDYWQSEPDKGIYDAMNKGIGLATGDYVAILNSDDFYELNACEIIKNEILKQEYDVYHAIERFIDDDGNIVNLYSGSKYQLNKQCLAHETCFIKKSLYEVYKYNEKDFKSAADYDLICLLYEKGAKFKFVEKIILTFRLGGMSDSILGLLEGNKVRYKYGYISFFDYFFRNIFYKIKLLF